MYHVPPVNVFDAIVIGMIGKLYFCAIFANEAVCTSPVCSSKADIFRSIVLLGVGVAGWCNHSYFFCNDVLINLNFLGVIMYYPLKKLTISEIS